MDKIIIPIKQDPHQTEAYKKLLDITTKAGTDLSVDGAALIHLSCIAKQLEEVIFLLKHPIIKM